MEFNLERYLSDGIEKLVKNALRVTRKSPKQIAFFLRYKSASQKAAKRRNEMERAGMHIPPFLIASITNECNLKCTGCYSRAYNSYSEAQELSVDVWARIFKEASDLGVSVILLAGGEPLLRNDVIEVASKQDDIIFPVFTNGTKLGKMTYKMFESHKNLIPIISIEGDENLTDNRRGDGVFNEIIKSMRTLNERMILFGASITVTAKNIDSVISESFVSELESAGCKVILFVEYVPVDQSNIALHDETRTKMAAGIEELRSKNDKVIIISFPGDEAESGGCLAAGRGFFHISATGNVEPCPFSPYSDLNIKDVSVSEAICSPFFNQLRMEGLLNLPHTGGCVLFEKDEDVRKLLNQE